jgi:hypothetical protein
MIRDGNRRTGSLVGDSREDIIKVKRRQWMKKIGASQGIVLVKYTRRGSGPRRHADAIAMRWITRCLEQAPTSENPSRLGWGLSRWSGFGYAVPPAVVILVVCLVRVSLGDTKK